MSIAGGQPDAATTSYLSKAMVSVKCVKGSYYKYLFNIQNTMQYTTINKTYREYMTYLGGMSVEFKNENKIEPTNFWNIPQIQKQFGNLISKQKVKMDCSMTTYFLNSLPPGTENTYLQATLGTNAWTFKVFYSC